MNLTVSIIASEIGLPLCGGFAYSYFSNCALDGPATTFLSPSTKKSETGTPLYGNSFFSTWTTDVVSLTLFLSLLVTSVLVLFVWSIALIWALDGPATTFLSPSTKKSETGTPLYGSSFFSSWALEGGDATFLSPSTKKSETGAPLYGNSFFSNCALDGPEATFLRPSMKKSDTGLPL